MKVPFTESDSGGPERGRRRHEGIRCVPQTRLSSSDDWTVRDADVIAALAKLGKTDRVVVWKCRKMLRREGQPGNHKRIYRVYRAMGLHLRRPARCSDPVNNCTWYFEPNREITMMQEPDKAMDRETQSGVDPVNIQGQTTIEEASREYDLTPSEIERWIDDAEAGMENALKANPKDVAEQYEKQLSDLKEAYGEAMLEVKFLKKLQRHLASTEE